MNQEIDQMVQLMNTVYQFFIDYSFQIVGALIIFLIGLIIASKISKTVFNFLCRKNIDITLSRFTASAVKIVILATVAIIALGKLGISVTPFMAIIGAASLGVGLALQGVLSNYGAGVTIIVARPFVVGDTITVQGITGIVKEVRLAYTLLSNEDETIITIPNKHIVGEIIHNSNAYSVVEMSVGIAYHCDPEVAINAIHTALSQIDNISVEKKFQVGIDNFGDSSIDLGVRFWATTANYFETKYRANLAIFKALAEHNIEIPFPQREVRMLAEESPSR